MQRAVTRMLPDGERMHLHHGPIDLIIRAWGPGRDAGYARAARRFGTVLQELVDELDLLRRPVTVGEWFECDMSCFFEGPTARRMATAAAPFSDSFITPMAAVAGAVADEILSALTAQPRIAKAYVNNGGDIALHLGADQSFTAAVAADPPAGATLTHALPSRGIATSGWRGRSQSLGIADSVTVLAADAATADAAATLIANAVDLPGHPGIRRTPAQDLAPDSDLGDRLVTTGVAALEPEDCARALRRGLVRAQSYRDRGLIHAAYLVLQGECRLVSIPNLVPAFKDLANA